MSHSLSVDCDLRCNDHCVIKQMRSHLCTIIKNYSAWIMNTRLGYFLFWSKFHLFLCTFPWMMHNYCAARFSSAPFRLSDVDGFCAELILSFIRLQQYLHFKLCNYLPSFVIFCLFLWGRPLFTFSNNLTFCSHLWMLLLPVLFLDQGKFCIVNDRPVIWLL